MRSSGDGLGPRNGAGAQLDAARMLHAAALVARQHDSAIFGKGLFDACVLFHPLDGVSHLAGNMGQLGHLGRVGLAMEDADVTAIVCGAVALKSSGCEREEVGGQRVALGIVDHIGRRGHRTAVKLRGIADGEPWPGQLKAEAETRLQVGLVEAGKHAAGMVGHKEGVQVVVMAVQCLVKAGERDADLIVSRSQHIVRNDDVLAGVAHRAATMVDLDKLATQPALEVDGQVAVARPVEHQRHHTRDSRVTLERHSELQVILHMAHMPGTVLRQLKAHSWLRPGEHSQ